MSHLRGVFLSYRRSDSQHVTERIHDRLVREFGEESVFLDVDKNIPPGVDYSDHLRSVVETSGVVLAVIGPTWLDAREVTDPETRRLASPEDFVRKEVETALADDSIVVIPLLVMGAQMPARDDLPEGMRDLASRQAFCVQANPYFHQEMTELSGIIRGHLGAPRFGLDLSPVTEEIKRSLRYAIDTEYLLERRWQILERFRNQARSLDEVEEAPAGPRSPGLEREIRRRDRRRLEEDARQWLVQLFEQAAAPLIADALEEFKKENQGDERVIAHLEEVHQDLMNRLADLVGRERYSEFLSLDDG